MSVVSEQYPITTEDTKDDLNFALALYKQLNGEDFPEETHGAGTALTDTSCENDEALAYDLQEQFDRTHDEELRRMEKVHNSKNTVGISYSNYYRSNTRPTQDNVEEPEDPSEQRDWDSFDEVNREFSSIPPCGYKMQKDGTILTKHDANMSGRRNACKLMNLPPEYETGDTASSGVVISNKPFNSLIRFSKQEQHRRMKMTDKKQRSTANHVLDQYTRQEIYKLISSEVIKSLGGTIQIGKEASVFYAEGNQHCPNLTVPKNCCIKIYKPKMADSKQRDQLKEDRRYKDKIGGQNSRKAVSLWAEREMANLLRLQRENIPCPTVITLKKHLLVMSLIGDNLGEAAPRLKHAEVNEEELALAYEQVVQIMKDMYSKADLIHGDLSEYNVLWHNKQCFVIDVSQSVEPSQRNSFHLLMRDCQNISNFFQKKGVSGVIEPDQLFQDITGTDYNDKESLASLRETIKAKPHHANMTNPPLQENTFEDTWEKVNSQSKDSSESSEEDK